MSQKLIFKSVAYLFFLIGVNCIAQTTDGDIEPPVSKDGKGFHAGLVVGTLFANKYTSMLYDGYGYDINRSKNDFANSWMYRKIIVEYGGGNGQPDRIAQELNVNHTDWSFSESDMPINLRYNIALLIGVQTRYCFNKADAIVFNANASKLNVSGNFTITLANPSVNPTTPGFVNTKTFSIIGGEQRLLMQLGYQRILGDPEEQINFFIEAGPMVSMAKFDKNQILINTLQIELTTFYNQIGYVDYRAQLLTGVGVGAFAGLGINLNATAKWTLQLLYSPSTERINLGANAKNTIQQVAGFRAYYNL